MLCCLPPPPPSPFPPQHTLLPVLCMSSLSPLQFVVHTCMQCPPSREPRCLGWNAKTASTQCGTPAVCAALLAGAVTMLAMSKRPPFRPTPFLCTAVGFAGPMCSSCATVCARGTDPSFSPLPQCCIFRFASMLLFALHCITFTVCVQPNRSSFTFTFAFYRASTSRASWAAASPAPLPT